MKKLTKVLVLSLAVFAIGCGEDNKEPAKKPEKKKVVKDVEKQDLSKCTYAFDASASSITWTAYKHASKVAVKGTFNDIAFDGPASAATPHELLMGLTGRALTESVMSNDTLRDYKISTFFFGNMADGTELKAQIRNLSPNYDDNMDASGTCMLDITMNAISFTEDASFTLVAGIFTLTANINMDDWALDKSYDAIHEACAEKHTAEADGEPITHKEVNIEISTVLQTVCD